MNVLKQVASNVPLFEKQQVCGKLVPVLVNFNDLYLEVKLLGYGASGHVKCYQNISDGFKYAMKEMFIFGDENLDHLEREVDILKELSDKINSNSIVKYYDSFFKQDTNGNIIFVIMTEYIEGSSLQSILEQMTDSREVLDVKTALRIAYWLFDTLDIIHKHEYVHRDIKPGNVMVDSVNNRFVLIDFGLTCSSNHESKFICDSNQYPGTVPYMAPETFQENQYLQNQHLQGQHERKTKFANHAAFKMEKLKMADIWAAGMLIYYAIEKKFPWSTLLGDVLVEEIQDETFEIQYILSDPISNVLSIILTRDPHRRPGADFIKNKISKTYKSFCVVKTQQARPRGRQLVIPS